MIRAQSEFICRETGNPKQETKRSDDKRHTHRLTAMVVDDDPIVLKLVAAMLSRIGFDVHTVGEGTNALFDFQSSPCDLVLTDYEMPIVNGYQMGRIIKIQRPATRVVIMTGLCRAAVAGMMPDHAIDGWLFKPFDLEKLKALLSNVGLPPGSGGETQPAAQALTRG